MQPPVAQEEVGTAGAAAQDKYQQKYKDLKKRVREIEQENDELLIKMARIRRNIYRLRLERKFLFERMGKSFKQKDEETEKAAPETVSSNLQTVQTPAIDSKQTEQTQDERRGFLHMLSSEAIKDISPTLHDPTLKTE
ncbi:hypothetical protein O9G_002671 [Rozella allomycis CSF55]|uniref:INO80 complex subunit F domain-containing protein n=1 Tax=Rozella allomycis (strain CSF55) TaxID=988480 RepID=A0A075B0V2_ROZAC|nr:hypothetical protein O9G_002671 [Rozella allomycis CSF55]|eukprot:EPZ36028.1 hypothetical protein O9G_002671 [Rozella allomycis CSF55]